MSEVIGEKIKSLRKDNGLTQKKLSELTGISEISIRKYENGDRNPKIEALERIAEVLNVQVDYILGRSDFKRLGSKIMIEDVLHLIEKIDNADENFSKLVRNIVDTMFLTINHYIDEKNTEKLKIIHDICRNIWNIKNLPKTSSAHNFLETDCNNSDEEFDGYKIEINNLLDKFYKISTDKD